LSISDGFEILQKEALRGIGELQRKRIGPNFIFLDPPYRMHEAYRETLELLANSTLSQHALIIAEHEKRFDPGEEFGILRRIRKLQQGDAGLSFYKTGC
jgi:16S rRNA G966 N2-methylase RsmD